MDGTGADWKKKENQPLSVRQAEQAGQTLNIDLCFVPWTHVDEQRLPAVSGSSGHLVMEHRALEGVPAVWPGKIFHNRQLSYETAMRRYAHQTRDRLTFRQREPVAPEREPSGWQQMRAARVARRQLVQKRQAEDAAWRAFRHARHQQGLVYRNLSRRRQALQAPAWQAQKADWAQRQQERDKLLAQRKVEDQLWHQRTRARKKQLAPRVWIAILVVTDNATRQCLGLPLFASGAHVTAREVVTALRTLLPAGLAFLISDQGIHFRSQLLAQLAQVARFVQIPVYRHRPQTNGIAERFVRTLKQELRQQRWTGPAELKKVLEDFLPFYNHRPHQGLAIPGLSPNEFANRLWLL